MRRTEKKSGNNQPAPETCADWAQRNEFICVASHELKTPLTALKLQVEMAKRALDRDLTSVPPHKMRAIIDRTYKDTLRLVRLVDDMLDVTRIKTGRLNINREYFALQDFLEEFQERLQPDFRAGLSWRLNAPVMVHWDRFRIEQVLLNLISNAIRYGENSPVSVTASAGCGEVFLAVKDEGPGIPISQQKKLFHTYGIKS